MSSKLMTFASRTNTTARTFTEALTTLDQSRHRHPDTPAAAVPSWAQLGAAAAAGGLALLAVLVGTVSMGYAVPLAVLAVAIFAGALIPDVVAPRWDAWRDARIDARWAAYEAALNTEDAA